MAAEAGPASGLDLISRLLASPNLLAAVAAQLSSKVDRRAARHACLALRAAVDAELATAKLDCKLLAGLAEAEALARRFPNLRELQYSGELQVEELQRLPPGAWRQVTRIVKHPTAHFGTALTCPRPPQLVLLARLCPRLELISGAAGNPGEAFAALRHLSHLTELLLHCAPERAPDGTTRTTIGSPGATLDDLSSLRHLALSFGFCDGDYDTMTHGLLTPRLGSVLTSLSFGGNRPWDVLQASAMLGLAMLKEVDLGDVCGERAEKWLQGFQLASVTRLSFMLDDPDIDPEIPTELCADESLNLIGAAFPCVEALDIDSPHGYIFLTDDCASSALPRLRELTVTGFLGGPLPRVAPNCTRLETIGRMPVIYSCVDSCPHENLGDATQLRELKLQEAPWNEGEWDGGAAWHLDQDGFAFLRSLPHLTCLAFGGLDFTEERNLDSEEEEAEDGPTEEGEEEEGPSSDYDCCQHELDQQLNARRPQQDALAAWCRDWGNVRVLHFWGSSANGGTGVCMDMALPLLAQRMGTQLTQLTIGDCELLVNENIRQEGPGGQGVLGCLPLFSALEELTLRLSNELSVCLDDESFEKFLAPLQAHHVALRRVTVVVWRGRDETEAPHVSWECCVRMMERYVPVLAVEYGVQLNSTVSGDFCD